MAAFTSATNTGPTIMDLIVSIVQEELVHNAFLPPTVMDFSAQVEQGIDSIKIPRYDTHFSDPDTQPEDGDATPQTLNFAVDTLALDVWKTLEWELPDQVVMQSKVPLEPELARSAGKKMARYIDDKIIEQLRLASTSAPDHAIDFSGDSGNSISLDDIADARELLNRANVNMDGRILLIPPEQESVLIKLDEFKNADKYGAREALLKGEIGQIYGFKVMVHNGLAEDEAVAYEKGAVAWAAQKQVTYETRRATLTAQKTEYAFSMGMGFQVLEEGRKQVYLTAVVVGP